MGLRLFSGSSDWMNNEPLHPLEPNPKLFKIVKHWEKDGYTLIKINYPNCKNYEGNKILIYNCPFEVIEKEKHLDPHFTENRAVVRPIMRLEPTEYCWNLGKKIIKEILTKK